MDASKYQQHSWQYLYTRHWRVGSLQTAIVNLTIIKETHFVTYLALLCTKFVCDQFSLLFLPIAKISDSCISHHDKCSVILLLLSFTKLNLTIQLWTFFQPSSMFVRCFVCIYWDIFLFINIFFIKIKLKNNTNIWFIDPMQVRYGLECCCW